MIISNGLNLAIAASFLVFAVVMRLPPSLVAEHTIAAAVILVVLAYYGVPGGVAKLVAATALWLGWLSGLMLACAAAVLLLAYYPIHRYVMERRDGLPYMPAHATAFAIALATGWITLPVG